MANVYDDVRACPFCGNRFPLAVLFDHVDLCAATTYLSRKTALGIADDVASLFDPTTDNDACVENAQEIVPGLFLGNVAAARDTEWLQSVPIVCIVNCAAEVRPLSTSVRVDIGVTSYHKFEIDDVEAVDFRVEICAAADALHEFLAAKASGLLIEAVGGLTVCDVPRGTEAVLCHCAAGVSRSAAVVITFLMRHRSMTLSQAALWVKRRRACVYPNAGFWRTLFSIENSIAAAEFSSRRTRGILDRTHIHPDPGPTFAATTEDSFQRKSARDVTAFPTEALYLHRSLLSEPVPERATGGDGS